MWRSSIVPDCSPASGGGIIVKRFFFAAGKQHDDLNKKLWTRCEKTMFNMPSRVFQDP
jgi:hypothetical protein